MLRRTIMVAALAVIGASASAQTAPQAGHDASHNPAVKDSAARNAGQWMGTAMQGGKKVNIALDYKGDVTTR